MMRRIFCAISFSALSACTFAAPKNDVPARQFLEEIVKADFDGDAFPRIGHVLPNDKMSGQGDHDTGPSFEVYMLDSDPLVVVNDWKFVSLRTNGPRVCGVFRFTVVAATSGEGLPSWMSAKSRHISAVKPPSSEKSTYCAELIGGRWMLIAPPLPRVNKNVLTEALREEVAQASKNAANPGSTDPRAATSAQRIFNSLKEQLAVLLSLQ